MQAAILPISAGWFWIQEGYRLFKRQPMPMFFWGMATGLLITISYLIPLFGQMALIAVTPILTFLTLCACRNIAAGKIMHFSMWLEPLKNVDVRSRLIKLGLAYMVCCLAAGFLAVMPFVSELTEIVNTQGEVDPHALAQAIRGPLLTFLLFYVVISALFWHAPALTGWHGMKLSQALFFSMVACWRNKWPFLLYGLSWGAIFYAAQLFAGALLSSGMSPATAQLLLTPLNIMIATLLYCSFYPTYISVFGANYRQDDSVDQ
ncbi:BPSS1780 family membrane protein [Paracandidimonas soli]|uniref:BPSS1780 family membrane protein n=1 Tax=Paracandidimonas soli TaxID=1917182 RepID=UPI00333F468A